MGSPQRNFRNSRLAYEAPDDARATHHPTHGERSAKPSPARHSPKVEATLTVF